MGYACPVCGAPQADGEHLANHLAFSALLGHDDHAGWLDEHAPGWGEDDPDALAERVVDHAEAVEYPAVFEDTTGHEGRPDLSEGTVPGEDDLIPGGEASVGGPTAPQRAPGPGELDDDARRAIEEARRMTERRRGGGGADDATDDGDGRDGEESADGDAASE